MVGFYTMLVLWMFDAILISVFFCLALEQRYSSRKTVLGAAIYFLATCILRIPSLLNIGIDGLFILNAASLAILFIYQYICFRAKWQLRILSVALIMVFMTTIELIAGKIGEMLTGPVILLDFQSRGWIITCLLCFLVTSISIYPAILVWNLFLRIKWEQNIKSWLSIVFPISQYIIMESYLENYGKINAALSYPVIIGLILGILADFYMFVLFYKENQRIHAEKELAKQKHLYELEKLRYENIVESQTEAARIRHDFQNYILTIRGLSVYSRPEE